MIAPPCRTGCKKVVLAAFSNTNRALLDSSVQTVAHRRLNAAKATESLGNILQWENMLRASTCRYIEVVTLVLRSIRPSR